MLQFAFRITSLASYTTSTFAADGSFARGHWGFIESRPSFIPIEDPSSSIALKATLDVTTQK
jgi:hypothetical protein